MMENRSEAPRYRVNTLSWIGNDLVTEGKEVTYKGNPGSNLEPLNAAAVAAVERFGRRLPPEIPQLPEPSAPPAVDWQAMAAAAGWVAPTMVQPERSAQAPQPDPKKNAGATEPVKAGTSAADKLNAGAAVAGQASARPPVDPGI